MDASISSSYREDIQWIHCKSWKIITRLCMFFTTWRRQFDYTKSRSHLSSVIHYHHSIQSLRPGGSYWNIPRAEGPRKRSVADEYPATCGEFSWQRRQDLFDLVRHDVERHAFWKCRMITCQLRNSSYPVSDWICFQLTLASNRFTPLLQSLPSLCPSS